MAVDVTIHQQFSRIAEKNSGKINLSHDLHTIQSYSPEVSTQQLVAASALSSSCLLCSHRRTGLVGLIGLYHFPKLTAV